LIKNKLEFLIFILIISSLQLSAQTDWVRWNKSENYFFENRQTDFHNHNFVDLSDTLNVDKHNIASSLVKFYKKTISDFDGDNCRFNPSCSEFFAESFKLTNLFTSVLMFFDRLTRDTNIFSQSKYKIIDNKLYDPPEDYIF